ncbi:MAG: polymerase delta subunit, terminal, partial [Chloroflexota bacterium]|nr:polymerase delta subunit, terminal [Chloroflexota bacterium]
GRLIGIRDVATRAAELVRAQEPGAPAREGGRFAGKRGRASGPEPEETAGDDGESAGGVVIRVAPAERRGAALALVSIWRELLRDLTLVSLGAPDAVRDPELLDELAAAGALAIGPAAAHLRRLDAAGEQLEGNVSPELVLDTLAIAWHA